MKIKTHSSAKKRVKISGTGKIILPKSCKRHLLANKSRKAKGRNQYGSVIHSTCIRMAQQCLPNA